MVKGFYFSLDAVMGLMLLSVAAGLIVTSTNVGGLDPGEVRFNSYADQAMDISYLMREEDFSVINQSYRRELVNNTVMGSDDREIGESLLKLYRNDSDRSQELAENYLETFEKDSGLYIEGDEIIGLNAETKAAQTFYISDEEGIAEFTVVVGGK